MMQKVLSNTRPLSNNLRPHSAAFAQTKACAKTLLGTLTRTASLSLAAPAQTAGSYQATSGCITQNTTIALTVQ